MFEFVASRGESGSIKPAASIVLSPCLGEDAKAGAQAIPQATAGVVAGGIGHGGPIHVRAESDLVQVGLGEERLEEGVGVGTARYSDCCKACMYAKQQ